jgi:hypothetical protein
VGKCKLQKSWAYLHHNPLLECSTNNVGKLLSSVWIFLKHIIPRNSKYTVSWCKLKFVKDCERVCPE